MKPNEPSTTSGSSGQTQPDYNQPVAYDQQGRPLYAHPPSQSPADPRMVYIARPIDPVNQPVSPDIMRRHEESLKTYPQLNLSRGEYIISAVKRHPIGLLQIWLVVAVLILIFGGLFTMLFLGQDATAMFSIFGDGDEAKDAGAVMLGGLFVLFILGGMVASYIYNSNRFFLTNESVIQEIQTTLLSRHEQTVSLSNIEDASYRQNGILPHLFNYGTIRLSTEGDETTYSFSYVAHPKRHIAVLNNAVEAFKNGRPVEPPGQDQPS